MLVSVNFAFYHLDSYNINQLMHDACVSRLDLYISVIIKHKVMYSISNSLFFDWLVLTPRPVEVQELYTQSSLEEFYVMADNLYPKLPKYRRPVYSKPKSTASSRVPETTERTTRSTEKPKFHPLGKQLLDAA